MSLDLAKQRPPAADLHPDVERFWRGMTDGLRVHAAALGMSQDATDWVAGEFLRRMRDVPYCPPDRVRRKQMPDVVAGLYHLMARKMFEVLRDWHATTKPKD